MKPWAWDYDLPDDWKPKTDDEWEWYLVRKINYEDLEGLKKAHLEKYFPAIERYKRCLANVFLNDDLLLHGGSIYELRPCSIQGRGF